jgi:cytochrome P450 family 4
MYSLLGNRKEFENDLKLVHGFTKSIIDERRSTFLKTETKKGDEVSNVYFRAKKQRYAMLDTLLQAESEGLITKKGIAEEVDTFIFEGHDTTSTAIIFILLLLAHNPEAQRL